MKVQRAFCLGFLVFSWKASGEVGVSVQACEVCAHPGAPAVVRLRYPLPSADDRVGCSPQRRWGREQKLATF